MLFGSQDFFNVFISMHCKDFNQLKINHKRQIYHFFEMFIFEYSQNEISYPYELKKVQGVFKNMELNIEEDTFHKSFTFQIKKTSYKRAIFDLKVTSYDDYIITDIFMHSKYYQKFSLPYYMRQWCFDYEKYSSYSRIKNDKMHFHFDFKFDYINYFPNSTISPLFEHIYIEDNENIYPLKASLESFQKIFFENKYDIKKKLYKATYKFEKNNYDIIFIYTAKDNKYIIDTNNKSYRYDKINSEIFANLLNENSLRLDQLSDDDLIVFDMFNY